MNRRDLFRQMRDTVVAVVGLGIVGQTEMPVQKAAEMDAEAPVLSAFPPDEWEWLNTMGTGGYYPVGLHSHAISTEDLEGSLQIDRETLGLSIVDWKLEHS